MSTRIMKATIQLKRISEETYNEIKDTTIPLKGEITLIDTASNGLRAKVGDGVKTLANIDFSDADIRAQVTGIVVRGYYHNGVFYVNQAYTEIIAGYEYKVYIDIPTHKAYCYDEADGEYFVVNEIPLATDSVSGISKLYDDLGNNDDGSITQKVISEELGKKFIVDTEESEETIIFTNTN